MKLSEPQKAAYRELMATFGWQDLSEHMKKLAESYRKRLETVDPHDIIMIVKSQTTIGVLMDLINRVEVESKDS